MPTGKLKEIKTYSLVTCDTRAIALPGLFEWKDVGDPDQYYLCEFNTFFNSASYIILAERESLKGSNSKTLQ